MKAIVLDFAGGDWDGKHLRTDSTDQEEAMLAAACFEMSHHGQIGAQYLGVLGDATVFARNHGWTTSPEGRSQSSHSYHVTERRETNSQITITFQHTPLSHAARE